MKNIRTLLVYVTTLVVVCLSIGYSAFHSELLINNIVADVRIEADIRITSFLPSDSTFASSSYYDYSVNSILTDVNLQQEDSIMVYEVEVTNFGNTEMVLYDISGLPDNLELTISEYILDDKICDVTGKCSLGAIKTMYITIQYKEGGFVSSNTEYSLSLDFDFREYSEVVVTLDYSFLPDNQFENLYDTSEYKHCCGGSSFDEYFSYVRTTTASDGLTYEATRLPALTTGEWDRGYYFYNKVARPLTDGVTYTLMFESKGSETFTALIGCEQDPYVHTYSLQNQRRYTIINEWTRHTVTFVAQTNATEDLFSFIAYDWAGSTWRTLKLRNVQLQAGNSDLYTDSLVVRGNRVIGALPTPTRSEWTFNGWYTSPLGGEKITSNTVVPNEDVTYYAQWTYNVV